ncbi:WD40-repeat-containing domain protein, partial [Clohesyomyces aquaticus]
HKDSIYEVAITTSHIITASRDQTLRVWLRSTHRLVCAPLKGHTASVLCVVAHEPANLILSGGSDRCLIAWDLLTYNRKVIVVDAHADSILCLAISDRIVGTGSKDKTIKIWDTGKLSSPSGRRDITPIATLEGHTGAVNAIVMTHDTIISVSGDRAIRVWDLATFQCTRVIGGYHERGIATLTLLPDRVSIACGSKDGTVRIFSFRTGVEEACLREHSGLVRAICNISDRAPLGPIPFTIASGGYDGSVVIW